MNTTPVYGCEGCKTTGGRMSCPEHGSFVIDYKKDFKQKLNERYGRCGCSCHDDIDWLKPECYSCGMWHKY